MNGAHDLGGMHGLGPVAVEADEPVFHDEWERRVFALTLAMGAAGQWNIDMGRFARENRPPGEYLAKSYYELWLAGLETLLVERGLVEPGELQSGRGTVPPKPVRRVLKATDVAATLERGGPCDRPDETPPRFAPGDAVVARTINPRGHTRLPRYARAHRGTIDRHHGVYVFPDSNASGRGEEPQHLYSVRFSARDLWGADADPGHSVHIDLWESYLEPA